MTINDDDIDFSFSEEETLKLQRVARVPRPEIPKRATIASLSDTFKLPRMPKPKKMQLERLTLTGTTSTVLRAIKRVNQYPPEYFAQAYNRQPLTTAIPNETFAPPPETRAISEAEPEIS